MKRTLAKVKKTEAEKEKGALDKYLSKSVDLFETEKSDKLVESDDIETNISKEITSEASSSFLSGCNAQQNTSELCINISIKDDPATWPNKINQNVRDYLVNKGPPKITVENFPQNEKGLHFSKFHCKRKLKNGEVIERPWLICSESFDKVYCYYCKLFDTNSDSALATSGFDSWSNIHTRLEDHEKSKKHLQCTLNCYELQQRLSTGLTVDTLNEKLIRQETKRWNQVFERLVASVQFLAERNLAFRGSEEQIGNPHNGNFLGVIELLGKFDPVMQDHIQKIINKDIHDHYLGKAIQDEIIDTIGQAVLQEIIARIKSAKYFAVILDCTPDISHQEHMSMVLRYVADGTHSDVPAGIYEHFIKFIIVESSTGENLFNTLVKEIEMLGLDVENIRGQGYDNGANMKGHNSGVQARLLERNSRAFYTPCVCYNYNLVLGDMAKTCSDGMTFFGTLQRIYTLFASSTKRWTVFKKHVKCLSVKPLSETRWECRMESVKAVRFQAAEVCDALEELAKSTNDARGKSEAESLVSQMTNYRFLVALCFWHSLLFQVNFTSKELQSNTIDIAAGLTSFEKLFDWLKTYRETGFVAALIDAKELANELEVEPIFQQKRCYKKKKMFLYESSDEPILDPKTEFRVNFFNQVVDKALQSLQPRLMQLKEHHKLFGFLYTFQNMFKEDLRKHSADLEIALTDITKDIEGFMLSEEMEAIKPILPVQQQKPKELFKCLACNDRSTAFPNLFIALKVLMTIPVTVASVERSFSKLKLIKTYLRSVINQERLNNLALISIESPISREINYEKILKDFASKKARKIHFDL
ncbi:52 kDa repressor of the inhibitor of the protein kinase-like [Hydra vulgaris]|uniref:52 kDa repressor of the inhibitor of the protein kinase-like n=1 Tax=Hydra vulgaris TaxID=6087 RepID=A0ABM4B1Y1_HYDVU